MAKRFLCYDTENPVGITEDGVLNPDAMGGGASSFEDMVFNSEHKMTVFDGNITVDSGGTELNGFTPKQGYGYQVFFNGVEYKTVAKVITDGVMTLMLNEDLSKMSLIVAELSGGNAVLQCGDSSLHGTNVKLIVNEYNSINKMDVSYLKEVVTLATQSKTIDGAINELYYTIQALKE